MDSREEWLTVSYNRRQSRAVADSLLTVSGCLGQSGTVAAIRRQPRAVADSLWTVPDSLGQSLDSLGQSEAVADSP